MAPMPGALAGGWRPVAALPGGGPARWSPVAGAHPGGPCAIFRKIFCEIWVRCETAKSPRNLGLAARVGGTVAVLLPIHHRPIGLVYQSVELSIQLIIIIIIAH